MSWESIRWESISYKYKIGNTYLEMNGHNINTQGIHKNEISEMDIDEFRNITDISLK